jgi:hypothetical protein
MKSKHHSSKLFGVTNNTDSDSYTLKIAIFVHSTNNSEGIRAATGVNNNFKISPSDVSRLTVETYLEKTPFKTRFLAETNSVTFSSADPLGVIVVMVLSDYVTIEKLLKSFY